MLLITGCGKKQVELEVQKISAVPAIDGKGDKIWDKSEWVTIGVPPADPVKKANLSGRFKILHDQANFYLLIDITDDTKFRRPPPQSALEAKYDFVGQGLNDCIVITFVVGDTKEDNTVDTRVMYIYDYDSAAVNGTIQDLSSYKLAQTKSSSGYTIEAIVPFQELKYDPLADLPIVARIAVMDNDTAITSPDQVTQPTNTIAWGTPLIWGTKDFGKLNVKR